MIGQDYITAGRAVFTLSGKDSRFTYRVSRKDPEPGSRWTQPTYFVGLLTGPDNTSDYRYLGILDVVTGYVRLTKGSKMTAQAPAVKAIQWALPKIWAHAAMPPSFSIHHEGHCGRCGRALTVPESIETGFGPECSEKLGITQATRPKHDPMAAARHSVAKFREQYAATQDAKRFATALNELDKALDPMASASGVERRTDGLFAVAFEEV